MNQSHTTSSWPPDLSNTTDYEAGTSTKSVSSILLLGLALPFGCLFGVLAIFFIFYFIKLRRTNRGTIDTNTHLNEHDYAQRNTKGLEGYEMVVLPKPTRSAVFNENGLNSAAVQNNAEEKEGKPLAQNSAEGLSNNGYNLEDYEQIILPNPTRSATLNIQ